MRISLLVNTVNMRCRSVLHLPLLLFIVILSNCKESTGMIWRGNEWEKGLITKQKFKRSLTFKNILYLPFCDDPFKSFQARIQEINGDVGYEMYSLVQTQNDHNLCGLLNPDKKVQRHPLSSIHIAMKSVTFTWI